MSYFTLPSPKNTILSSLRHWLESIDVRNRKLAYFICKLIPAQCPFEHNIIVFGKKVLYIPPMCKLNPLYDEVIHLRFKALCYLVDECGDVILR
ncbi:hypothetical protein DSM106972_050000 [Dulcicalothrix desertica PCC 7102]|uniref:Mo-dependent nitrogenase C-terminal domain-containing protein n=1 Tax=Dulcicalothrix desertica PCC 7102 TaxID=232991 RepID=A0A3S1IXP1_9CYAN|nr:Mo-dependent nitrogenase C-terminal domain-containing protein [Dulcicalothrix desertica]RUT04086.1 hypothetical protein DSM106972_050000 [Dulcicalothrix desertica PCC 7102]TWH43516.1 Mo-dependent nitrogenase-like protein [Dulcicalothrix desertica PCC 7102]